MESDEDDDDGPPMLVNVDEVEESDTQTNLSTQETALTRNHESENSATSQNNDQSNDENDDDSNNIKQLGPCPVTILSGFLGSGKTTLIQYILKSPNHGKRIAVIENEYGEGLQIESLIARDGVASASDESGKSSSLMDLIELPNGCLCCTVKDSLVVTLENLLTKRQDLDYILIECSGMANPGPIASLFWLDEALDSRLRLDGIVTLCDAAHISHQLETTLEAAQQIAYADRILLNKVDLVKDPNELDRITHLIRECHSTAPLQLTSYSSVPDLDWILDANCFDGERLFGQILPAGVDNNETREDAESSHQDCAICNGQEDSLDGHDHDHSHAHTHTQHVSTVSLVKYGSVDRKRMDQWLDSIVVGDSSRTTTASSSPLASHFSSMARSNPQHANDGSFVIKEQSIFRIKGVLSLYHSVRESADYDPNFVNDDGLDQRRFIVQGVYDLWEIHPSSNSFWTTPTNTETEDAEPRCCKLVVIGRFLNQAALKAGFEECFVVPPT